MNALEKARKENEELKALIAEKNALQGQLATAGAPATAVASAVPKMNLAGGLTFNAVCGKLDALQGAKLVLADGVEIPFGPAHESGSANKNATRSISGKYAVPGVGVELSVSASFTYPKSGLLPRE